MHVFGNESNLFILFSMSIGVYYFICKISFKIFYSENKSKLSIS